MIFAVYVININVIKVLEKKNWVPWSVTRDRFVLVWYRVYSVLTVWYCMFLRRCCRANYVASTDKICFRIRSSDDSRMHLSKVGIPCEAKRSRSRDNSCMHFSRELRLNSKRQWACLHVQSRTHLIKSTLMNEVPFDELIFASCTSGRAMKITNYCPLNLSFFLSV